jgi:hypothetical protein
MKRILTISILVVAVAAVAVWITTPYAYQRYNDGCNGCHGTFPSSTSPKGTVFPSGNKHTMHRSASHMNTECDLCHTTGDNRNPYTGSSDGTPSNTGLGCTGCHEATGLRLHHINNNETICSTCHTDGPPPPESQFPPYYGTVDTNADEPCNDFDGTSKAGENWSVGDFLGLDNDGDNDYDMNDANCGGTITPGESGASASMIVTNYNKSTGEITISYTDACETTDSNIEYGDLANVSSYTYTSSVCDIGDTGTATFTLPAGSQYFLVVGDNGGAQGSYGLGDIDADGTLEQRPDNDTDNPSCPIDQGDLGLSCG